MRQYFVNTVDDGALVLMVGSDETRTEARAIREKAEEIYTLLNSVNDASGGNTAGPSDQLDNAVEELSPLKENYIEAARTDLGT